MSLAVERHRAPSQGNTDPPVRTVRISAGLLSIAMSLKTVGLAAALFIMVPSVGTAVTLLTTATLVGAMLAGAAVLFLTIGVGLLAGTRGKWLGAMGVGIAAALVVQIGHVASLLNDRLPDLRVSLSLVEIGIEIVLATCIGVLYAAERRTVNRVPDSAARGGATTAPRSRRDFHHAWIVAPTGRRTINRVPLKGDHR